MYKCNSRILIKRRPRDVTVLKDEPEDLTHLAPTPGDVCVPLEDTPFLSDMLDEFILGSDNYCPLLSPDGTLAPELRATDFADHLKDAELGDTPRNKDLGESLADSDPFMYGDSPSSPCSIDPSAVSPPLAKYRQVSCDILPDACDTRETVPKNNSKYS